MAKTNIIPYWSYMSQYTHADGSIDYNLKLTDYLGNDYYVSGTAPAGSDMGAVARQQADTKIQLLITAECDQTTNAWTWDYASDPIAFPTDAQLSYADQIDVANFLRPMYQTALGVQLVNYAAALIQLSDATLRTVFELSDVTELKQRLNRQAAIRTQLANETGE